MTRLASPNSLALASCSGMLVFCTLAMAPVGPGAIASSQDAQAQSDSVSFAEDVAPILEANCVQCHGGEVDGVVVKEVSLDLTTYEGVMAGSEFGSVVEANKPDDSFLFVMVEAGDMPLEGEQLPPEQIEIIRKWIEEGALNN